MDLKDFFLKQKQAIRNRSREVFALVRPQDFDWRPEREALSVGELMRHIWVSEEGVRRVALEGNFAYFETRIPKGLRAVTGSPTTLAEEIRDLARVHEETMTAVETFPSERFEEERGNPGLNYHRKIAVILLGINEHEIHHRAQLMTYLRMRGNPVPEALARR